MNDITLKGRLVRDPEQRVSTSGTTLASFSIAVDRAFKKDEADFFNCVAFGKTAEFITNYFAKGKEILLKGEMQCSKKENNYYWNVVVNRVEFCGPSGASEDVERFMPVDENIEEADLPF